MITVCTNPKQPVADELVSDCTRLTGGVKGPSIAKKPLEVINTPTDFWQDEETEVYVTEDSGAVITLA